MQGLLVFRSLQEANREGFSVYDRTTRGYIVRARRPPGCVLALVEPD